MGSAIKIKFKSKFRSVFLTGVIFCLFFQSGCGLTRRFIRPFPEEPVAEKEAVRKKRRLARKRDTTRKTEGRLKIVKKLDPEDLNIPDCPFPPEERFIYGVKWRGVPIGEIRLIIDGLYQLNNGKIVYRLLYEAATNPLFDVIYKVRDEIVSYFDCYTLLPWKTEKYLREGGYRRTEVVEFDRDKNEAAYVTSNPPETVEIRPGAQDILSFFYYYRTKDIELGKSHQMVVFSDRKNWDLILKTLKKKRVNTYLGKMEAILVEPEAKFRGVFFRKATIQFYIRDDGSKMPVVITAKRPFFGSLTATLLKSVR